LFSILNQRTFDYEMETFRGGLWGETYSSTELVFSPGFPDARHDCCAKNQQTDANFAKRRIKK